jgi:raffinose/stachyose/melibiose transport system permease protein
MVENMTATSALSDPGRHTRKRPEPRLDVARDAARAVCNEFFLALILSPGTPTLQVGINNLRGYYSTEGGYIFAGVMVAALPVILAYVLLTKQFIRGLTAGALKG